MTGGSQPCVNCCRRWRRSVPWRGQSRASHTAGARNATQRSIARPRFCPVWPCIKHGLLRHPCATLEDRPNAECPDPDSSARHYAPTRGSGRSGLHGATGNSGGGDPRRAPWVGDEGFRFLVSDSDHGGFTGCQARLPSSLRS